MEILLLIALIVLNGLFAMSEITLVTARRARLARLSEDGDGAAEVAIKLHDEPTRFLSTVQIGITSIGILNGMVGESALAEPFAIWLQEVGFEQQPSEIGAAPPQPSLLLLPPLALHRLPPLRPTPRLAARADRPRLGGRAVRGPEDRPSARHPAARIRQVARRVARVSWSRGAAVLRASAAGRAARARAPRR